MSRRDNAAIRCATCALHQSLCICALVKPVTSSVRLVLVVHHKEARKPTNTGQLAARCLADSVVVVTGREDAPPLLPFAPGERAVLLYPEDDAVPLAQLAPPHAAPPQWLVVPDGSWRQAQKMRRRVPGLSTLPCATLPAGPKTTYQLRSEPKDGGLATLEAIARAYAVLDPNVDVAAALLRPFEALVDRTLWLRGALSSSQVRGGLPEGARRDAGVD